MKKLRTEEEIKINPDWMDYIEKGAELTKPAKIFFTVIYILVAVFAINNLINYFS